jgi:hypothetical protein
VLFGRVSRITFDIVGTLVVLVVLAAGLLGWRLSMGPISLGFLTPLIERALSDTEDEVAITVENTVLAWGGWSRTFDVRVHGLRALGKEGHLMIEVPEVSISLSALGLLHGLIAPTALEAIGGRVVIVRGADGAWHFSAGDPAEDTPSILPLLLAELLAPPDPSKTLGYLRRASLVNSAVTLVDETTKRVWIAHDATIVVRRDEGGLRAEMAAQTDIGGKTSAFSGDASYFTANRTLEVNVHLANLDPASLAAADPILAPLAGIAVPLSGEFRFGFDEEFRLARAGFRLAGSNGRLDAAALHMPRDTPVRRVSLRGRLPDGLATLELEEALIDLGGPTIALQGRVIGLDGNSRAEGTVTIRDVATDELRWLWPHGVGENARLWVTENLTGGRILETKVDFALARRETAGGSDTWAVGRVAGKLRFNGVAVNYLNPMPKVLGVDGDATFNASRFDITLTSGGLGNLKVGANKIALYALDTDVEMASIDVAIGGPLREQLALVDNPPLGYLKKIDLKAEDFSGEAATRLQLKFPLAKNLKVDQIDVVATADAKDVGQRKAALGQDVADGQLNVRVDRQGLDVSGRVKLGPTPATVEIRRNFADNAPVVARTRARGRVASAADRAAFGFDTLPYIDGPTTLALDYVELRGGRSELTLDASLDEATISIAQLDWAKPPGSAATARLAMGLSQGKLTSITKFTATAGDPAAGGLTAEGRIDFAADGATFARADVATLKTGLTDMRGKITRLATGGLGVDVAGPSFNVGPFLHDSTPSGERMPLDLRVDVDRLYFASDRWLDRLRFEGKRSRERWETAELTAQTGDELRLTNQVALTLQRFDNGSQALQARAEDAGAFLKALDISPNIAGGRLEVSAATDEKRPRRPLAGHLHMSEHRIIHAPVLARVLSVALLTGIVDSLTGEGIRFSRLDAAFVYGDPIIEISDAIASGPALGVTARGRLDLDAETIELDGTIVPANAINGLLGRIPVFGDILIGRGGGLFAVNYSLSGPMAEPKVSVNPLSALAPGILRNLFGTLPGTSATDSTPESEKEIQRERARPPATPTPP